MTNDIIHIITVVILIGLSTIIYKKCQKKVHTRPKPMFGFFKQYWYDMKCTYLVILFAVSSSFLSVELIKWLST